MIDWEIPRCFYGQTGGTKRVGLGTALHHPHHHSIMKQRAVPKYYHLFCAPTLKFTALSRNARVKKEVGPFHRCAYILGQDICMTEREKLELAIATLEQQRAILGDLAVETVLAGLRQKLAELQTETLSVPKVVVMAGERKLATVMFADIAGFTALSEKLDPEQVRSIINACFDALVPIIEKYGGVVDKFIGDEIMALFGTPKTHENDAERALRAALEMMQALAMFNARYQIDLGMHLGINSGLVVAGGLGSEGRQQYSVIGDTVNLAARLEDASETGAILVGLHTYHLTAPLFEFETLMPIRVKGKAEPVPIYRLIGLKAVPGPTRGIAGLRSPLVGRAVELAKLRTAVQSLASGKGSAIAIIGEPGLGKSRLIAELRRVTEMDLPGIRWAEGHTQSYTEGMSYWVVRSVLDSLLGTSMEMPTPEVGEALWRNVSALVGAQAEEVYPYLARLREVSLDARMEERVKYVLPEAMQSRMQRAFGNLVRAISQKQPVVLAWEDLHWADPSSLSLLETLLPLTDEAAVLLLLVFRPNEGLVEKWHQRARASRGEDKYQIIELTPLTRADSTRLVENLLKIENMPETTRQVILSKAEGNPFFLEELLSSLLDAGYVLLDSNRAVITSAIENLDVPDTLQGVIAARIDRLPPEDKRTLQTASVLGRVFQQMVLGNLLDHDRADVRMETALVDLQQKELIRWRGELEYIFKHAVTQEVTYNSLLIARRKELHRVAAEVIESLFPGQLEELSATLAYHYERADVGDKAIYYFIQAADRARKTYSNAEAMAFYQAALKQASQLQRGGLQMAFWRERTTQLYERLGDVLALMGRNDEARNAYRDALAHVPAGDGVWQSRLHRNVGNTWRAQRQLGEAQEAYNQAQAALSLVRAEENLDWQQASLEIALDRLETYYFSASISQMQTLAENIAPAIQQHGMPVQRAKYFLNLCSLALRQDRYLVSEKTLGYAQTALAASHEADHKGLVIRSTFQVGFNQLWRGDLERAKTELQAALELAEQIGDQEHLLTSLTWLTVTYRRSGQSEKVQHYAARSLEVATINKTPLYIGLARANLAWVAWRNDNLAEAQVKGCAALDLLEQGQAVVFCMWLALLPLMDMALRLGNDSEAIEYARVLLHPTQMHLTEALEEILAEAVKAWDSHEADKAHLLMQQGIEMAKQTGWM